MTYQATDSSRQDGRPIELYRFVNGANVWRYCTGEALVPYGGEQYTPATIIRSQTESSQEFGKSQLNISVPFDLPIARFLSAGLPLGFVSVTVFRAHLGDDDYITHWRGRVLACNWKGTECTINCEPVFTSLQRSGLRMVYQRQCRHALYSDGCSVNKSTYAVPGRVDTAIQNQVFCTAAAAFPDNYFTGGMLETADGMRLIVAHTGTSLTLITPLPTLTGGTGLNLYPGCDHTLNTCATKFFNSINFGGQPWLPQKNPFSGDAVM